MHSGRRKPGRPLQPLPQARYKAMPRQLVSWQPWALETKVRGAPPLDLSPWELLFVFVAEQLFKQAAWGSSIFLIKCPPSLGPRKAGQPGAGALARADTQPQRGCMRGPTDASYRWSGGTALPHPRAERWGGGGHSCAAGPKEAFPFIVCQAVLGPGGTM